MKQGMRILVIDAGTSGTRALIIDENSRCCGQSYSEFTQYYPAEDRVEHDPEEIWITTRQQIDQALTKANLLADELATIAITNQRATTVLWDRKTGDPVTRAIVWQDLRTAAMADQLRDSWGDRVQSRTGWTLAPVYSALSLAWLLEHDEDLARRARAGELAFGTIDSWLIHRLTGGATHVISASNAAVTGAYDLLTDDWYADWLERLGVPLSLFPEIIDDSGRIAETSAAVLGAQVPINAAVADQSAALFGQHCLVPGAAKTTHGTGTFLDVNVGDTPVISKNGLSSIIAWRRNGQTTYGLEGYVALTGAVLKWLGDGVGLVSTPSEIHDLARTVEDTGGVCFVPALSGLGAPSWDSSARGLLIGMSPGTTRAHLARAALEGIVNSVKDFLTLMATESECDIASIRADGGAARNDSLLQIQADLLGVQVVRPSNIQATALGAAYMAGLAAGVWTETEDCFANGDRDAEFKPSFSDDERATNYRRWQRAVERSMDWSESI